MNDHLPRSKPSGFLLKISLRPKSLGVVRRIEVPADLLLADLHEVIELAFDWRPSELYGFVIDDDFVLPIDVRDPQKISPTYAMTVGQAFGAADAIQYRHAFRDDRIHDVEIEATLFSSAQPVPVALGGEGLVSRVAVDEDFPSSNPTDRAPRDPADTSAVNLALATFDVRAYPDAGVPRPSGFDVHLGADAWLLRVAQRTASPWPIAESIRDVANLVTVNSFRNGFLERLHETRPSRITDPEMKKLMIESSARVALWLLLLERYGRCAPERMARHVLRAREYIDGTPNLGKPPWEHEAVEDALVDDDYFTCSCGLQLPLDMWSFCPSCGCPKPTTDVSDATGDAAAA